ncbi:MAG: efflux RND transporter periplasmic adaptor subunit [bacterium]
MNYKRTTLSIIAICLCILGWYAFNRIMHRTTHPQNPFTTDVVVQKTIRHTVHTTGILKIKDSIRVGSLVAGLIKEIFVEENDVVKKGQLLALIDHGRSDTSIREAEGKLLQAQSLHTYTSALFAREKELFAEGLRSAQEFESITHQYNTSAGNLMIAQAQRDATTLEFENTHIRAPEDGIIIAIGIKKGVRITTDLDATVLFEIAKDITKMEAELNLEESAAGHIKRGQKVVFSVDNHPHKTFKTTIRSVSYAPYKTSTGLVYRATVDIDNKAELLRPGMTLHATIKVAKKKNIPAIQQSSLYVDPAALTTHAKKLNYQLNPLPPTLKKAHTNDQTRTIKYVWVLEGTTVAEKPVETGIYDDQFIEITQGLEQAKHYICDVCDPNLMDAHYKKIFKGAL